MQELDPRIVIVGIEVNGLLKTYDGLAITATGTKYANANQNEMEIKIFNLDKETRDYILTETSPFNLNRTPKRVILDAGRQSYGVSRIFLGDVTSATPSQPPDIAITLKCLTGNFQKGNVVARNQSGTTQLSQISKGVADDLGVTLDFQATEKQISNYTFTGGALNQVGKLGETGAVNAYVDDGVLVVKNAGVPLANQLQVISADTGMIGIPELTEQGIKVKFLINGQTVLGGALRVESTIYPAVNGVYTVYKLGFDIASRDTPFYWIAEGKRKQ